MKIYRCSQLFTIPALLVHHRNFLQRAHINHPRHPKHFLQILTCSVHFMPEQVRVLFTRPVEDIYNDSKFGDIWPSVPGIMGTLPCVLLGLICLSVCVLHGHLRMMHFAVLETNRAKRSHPYCWQNSIEKEDQADQSMAKLWLNAGKNRTLDCHTHLLVDFFQYAGKHKARPQTHAFLLKFRTNKKIWVSHNKPWIGWCHLKLSFCGFL